MKIKCHPQDFQVGETTEFVISTRGEFSVYRLSKSGLGTPEAIDSVLRRWKLSRRHLSYGGLKDRHAATSQHVTIWRGPRRNLEQTNLRLEYLGQAERHFEAADIAGNHFGIVIRDLSPTELATALAALPQVAKLGLPNYYDDQRFGSVTGDGEYIGAAWVREDYERCIWLALAAPHPSDRSQEKKEKQILRDHWGRWAECQPKLGKSHRRSIVTYLVDHPTRFRDAWALVRVDMRSLYLSAFQSHLWNRLTAKYVNSLRDRSPELAAPGITLQAVEIGQVDLPFWTDLSPEHKTELSQLELPLPSARTKLEDHPLREFVESTMTEFGFPLTQLKIKHHRDSFFSKGSRPVLVEPRDLSWTHEPDEYHAGHSKLAVSFTLTRGSYATVLVKRITVAARLQDMVNDDQTVDASSDDPLPGEVL